MEQKIFERLAEERERLGLNKSEMAIAGGIAKPTYLRYESGGRSPDGAFFAQIAAAGADVLYILTGQRGQPVAPEATLPVDERVLLNNYRMCNDQARQNLIQTSALLSAGMAVPGGSSGNKKPASKAAARVTQLVTGMVSGSVVAGDYKGE